MTSCAGRGCPNSKENSVETADCNARSGRRRRGWTSISGGGDWASGGGGGQDKGLPTGAALDIFGCGAEEPVVVCAGLRVLAVGDDDEIVGGDLVDGIRAPPRVAPEELGNLGEFVDGDGDASGLLLNVRDGSPDHLGIHADFDVGTEHGRHAGADARCRKYSEDEDGEEDDGDDDAAGSEGSDDDARDGEAAGLFSERDE